MKYKIGDKFKITKENNIHECYIGQEVEVIDLDYAFNPTCYLIQDAKNEDYFCCLQNLPIEDCE